MSSSKPQKISSVLARFEQTIQENNAKGGGGGMYLTNQASKKTVKPAAQSLNSRSMEADSGTRRMSVSAGSYRHFLQADPSGGGSGNISTAKPREDAGTASTTGMTDADWDPFYSGGESSHANTFLEGSESQVSESEQSFRSDDEEEDSDHSHARRRDAPRRRPREPKRVGRLGNRKTRTSRPDPKSRSSRQSEEEEEVSERNSRKIDGEEKEEEESGFKVPQNYHEQRSRTTPSRPRSQGNRTPDRRSSHRR